MTQHVCWDWNPDIKDAKTQLLNVTLFEGSLPHPPKFHWLCWLLPVGSEVFSYCTYLLSVAEHLINPRILRQRTHVLSWVLGLDHRSIPNPSHLFIIHSTWRSGDLLLTKNMSWPGFYNIFTEKINKQISPFHFRITLRMYNHLEGILQIQVD